MRMARVSSCSWATPAISRWQPPGIAKFPQARGVFYFVRRPFKPRWLENFVYGRSRRLGFGTLPKQGSLDLFVERLGGRHHPVPIRSVCAWARWHRGRVLRSSNRHVRSLAILALTPAPRSSAACWREPDGHHVLRFEEALAPIACEDHDEESGATPGYTMPCWSD
jgi:hypothetical protein